MTAEVIINLLVLSRILQRQADKWLWVFARGTLIDPSREVIIDRFISGCAGNTQRLAGDITVTDIPLSFRLIPFDSPSRLAISLAMPFIEFSSLNVTRYRPRRNVLPLSPALDGFNLDV